MNSSFYNKAHHSTENQWNNRKSGPHSNRYKSYQPNEGYENQNLREYKSLLDHFNMSSETMFDENLLIIMRSLKVKQSLEANQINWLTHPANQALCNSSLMNACHSAEALRHMQEYKESNEPVHAINGAKQFIAAKQVNEAIKILTENQAIANCGISEVVAFYYFTLASAQKDLRYFEKGKDSAIRAHKAWPEEPTSPLLLGAFSLHLNQVQEAVDWYAKARQNGISADNIQNDMKNTVKNIPVTLRHQVVKELIGIDAHEYKFLRGLLPKSMQNI